MTAIQHKNSANEMRSSILRRRYLWKDKNGRVVETEKKMCHRVALVIATVEKRYGATVEKMKSVKEKFYKLISTVIFLPNSPTLMNAGRKNGLLSACFVLPLLDSLKDILKAVMNTGLIQKAGGGTGFDFSQLRPTGDIVASSGGRTSGPISFGGILAETTHAIQQGAHRRGANMGMMSVDHPDILRFIHTKNDPTAFTNFNFSVKVPDTFMKQLKKNPETSHVVINPRTKKRYAIPHSVNVDSYTIDNLLTVDHPTDDCYTVKEIWNMIIENAYGTGEPGICFIDRVNTNNPTPELGQIEACNPCGEQPLLPYESCNLGSINISKFVTVNNVDLDWNSLKDTIKLAVRFLDNVIDANYYPIPEIRKVTLGNRKIGLGIMGFADTLVLLRIRYDSEQAVEFAEKLMSFVQNSAHDASEELAKERGSFPNWNESIWNIKYHRQMRNTTCTTIAPTGTIGIIAGCSSGIEPIFSFTTKRRILDGQEFIQLQPLIERLGTKEGWLTDRVRDLLSNGVLPYDIPEIPKDLADVLVTAHEVSPEWHVRIQAAFQKYTDNAVSKTVNLRSDATVEDVDKVYRLAFELGCKGITVYRDNSRENQVITTAHKTTQPNTDMLSPRPRPHKTVGQTIKSRTGCGTLFISVNKDKNGLCEVFANLGKAGGCPSQSEATCRVVSAALRCGVDPRVLIEQLKNIRCLSTIARRKDNNDVDVLSCPDAIGRAIEEILGENCDPERITLVNRCPECDHLLRRESGCNVCDECGYSKCD